MCPGRSSDGWQPVVTWAWAAWQGCLFCPPPSLVHLASAQAVTAEVWGLLPPGALCLHRRKALPPLACLPMGCCRAPLCQTGGGGMWKSEEGRELGRQRGGGGRENIEGNVPQKEIFGDGPWDHCPLESTMSFFLRRAVDWENLQQPSGAGKPSEIRSFSERKDNAAVVAPGITGSRGPKRLLYRRAQMDKGVTAMEDVDHASRDEAPAPAPGMKNRTTSRRFTADVPRGASPLSLLRTGMAPSRPNLVPWLALSTDVDSLAGPQLWSPDDIFCCELLVGYFFCFYFAFCLTGSQAERAQPWCHKKQISLEIVVC
ncbi:uncharacterized protein LOC114582514 isoform X1 [Podarcis muralis]